MTERQPRTLTAAELADECGASEELVHRLVAMGSLHEVEPGRHELADIARVEAVLRLVEAGIGIEVFEAPIVAQFANLDQIGRYFFEPAPRSTRTYAEFRASFGARAHLLGPVYAAFGLPEPPDERRLRIDEEKVIAGFVDAWSLSGDEAEPYVRAARLVGEAARDAVEGWTNLWGEVVYRPLVAREGFSPEVNDRIADYSMRLNSIFPTLSIWLQQRHLSHAINELYIGSMETALEEAGLRPPRIVDPPAVAFVDLTGYTSLTEQVGDELAARSAARLQELADASARRHDGRLVKLLGDGAMLRFTDATAGVTAILELVDEIGRSDLPSAHAGMAAGRVFGRDGDLFGRTVNLAARISGQARAGQVYVEATTVETWSGDGVHFEAIGDVSLKGISEPVALWRVVAAD
jgi:adenylate cyclase